MVIHCIAYVGKLNEPLFVHVDNSTLPVDNSTVTTKMYLESIVHASLDIIEERRARKPQSTSSNNAGMQEMFLGQVHTNWFSVFIYFIGIIYCSYLLLKIIEFLHGVLIHK